MKQRQSVTSKSRQSLNWLHLVARSAAALILFWCPPHPAVARALDEIKASNLLRIAVYDDNRPFSWSDSGRVVGIEADIGRALAKRLGVAAEFVIRPRGETTDDDLKSNVSRGPQAGGPVGDVMLHVPLDLDVLARAKGVVVGNAYFDQRIAIAVNPSRTGSNPGLDVFRRERIGVARGSLADYFLMFHDGGALRANIAHFEQTKDGVAEFVQNKTAAIMGIRSEIEALLHVTGMKPLIVELPLPGIMRATWRLGTAVKDNAPDLSAAIGRTLAAMTADGELAAIFARHGVTYIVPGKY